MVAVVDRLICSDYYRTQVLRKHWAGKHQANPATLLLEDCVRMRRMDI